MKCNIVIVKKMTGEEFRAIRKKLGLTQLEFAKQLGVTSTALAYWERGERTISGPIARLASILGSGKVTLNMKTLKKSEHNKRRS